MLHEVLIYSIAFYSQMGRIYLPDSQEAVLLARVHAINKQFGVVSSTPLLPDNHHDACSFGNGGDNLRSFSFPHDVW